MAKSIQSFTWKKGFREAGEGRPWATEEDRNGYVNGHGNGNGNGNGVVKEQSHYVTPPFAEALTSTVHNDLGLNTLRTWPTIYNGTSSPHGLPGWWKPSGEVDVLICGGM
jgi:phenol 2-monooxygenase (NADPH)